MLPDSYKLLCEKITRIGLDVEKIKAKLKSQRIETPSWGYSDSGTRFKVFKQPGVPRNVFERLEDAAYVHRITGVAPSVALHIPWDMTEDWKALKKSAQNLGIEIGAINPNVFQDDCYKLGSFANENPAVRQRAVEHHFECIEIMRKTGSRILSLWYADGTNYPGQGDFRRRKRYFLDCLVQVYSRMQNDERMLIEYKFFEPAFYHTDIADWGMAYCFATRLGEQAQVLVDLGHHPQGTNIEHIVAFLIDEGKLGGFHFNNRKYADDDLTAGSINPYELFLVYCELGANEEAADNVVYMIDQSHNIKPKLEAMIQTIMNLQTAYAKALIVDRRTLTEAQIAGDVVAAEQQLIEAFNTDVEPLLAQVRTEIGIAPNPLAAHKASDYLEKIILHRRSSPAGQD